MSSQNRSSLLDSLRPGAARTFGRRAWEVGVGGHTDLSGLGLAKAVRLGSSLRTLSRGCASVEEFGDRLCRHLHENLTDSAGAAQSVLVRFYATVPFGALPRGEQDFVRRQSAVHTPDTVTCLALLGTVGTEPSWNDRLASRTHRVRPLSDEEQVASLPMVAALLAQLGVHVPRLINPRSTVLAALGEHHCGVFHVPVALGSPAIPAQQFVTEHGIASVLGFGGTLPTGEVWAVVLFSRASISHEQAQLFEAVALSTELAELDLLEAPLFTGHPVRQAPIAVTALKASAARVLALEALLVVNEQVAALESTAAVQAVGLSIELANLRGEVASRLQLAQGVAGLGMWEWQLSNDEVAWDEHAAALHGLALPDFDGQLASVSACIHLDDRATVQAVLGSALDQAAPVEVGYRAVWSDGTVRHLLSRGQAVADEVGGGVRVLGAVLDVSDLREAAAQRAEANGRMAGLVAVAQALGDAQTELAVLQVVTDRGAQVLGADGVVLTLLDSAEAADNAGQPGQVRALTTASFGESVRGQVAVLPLDFPLPMVRTVRTGEAFYLPDRAAAIARFPSAGKLYREAKTEASASVPLRIRSQLLGSLSVSWTGPRVFSGDDVELLEVFAGQCAQALDRIASQENERRAAAAARGLSETLQRSLLTAAPVPADLDIAVRYQAAAEEAQVGGDWYDAFRCVRGVAHLVIGDVTGHDRTAAATMGQIRNVLRALSYNADGSTADVLQALERTLSGLGVEALASTVLMRVDPPSATGSRRLHWTNAGHLPPLLRHPDGSTSALGTPPELLLGFDTARREHSTVAEEGTMVLLYTDGLVERRGEDLDDGLSRLQETLAELGHLPLEDLCEQLLARLASDEDDVAVLAARLGPQL